MRALPVILLALGAVAAFRLASTPQSSGSARIVPSKPSGYFPPEVKLQGTVKLLTPPVVKAGERSRIRIEYTVGDQPVEPGLAIEIWKHFTSDVEEFQITDASAPAYFTAAVSAAAVTAKPVKWTNWEQRNTPAVFPYRKTAGIEVESGALRKGDKVTFDLGGAQGVRMQYYEEQLFNFRVVITRKGLPVAYGGDAILQVTGGPLAKLRVQAPSVVKLGEAFPVEVVPEDAWTSLAANHTGLTLRLSGNADGGQFRYEPQLLHYVARDVKARAEGVLRLEVSSADGKLRAISNPIWVERDPLRRIYFGELHQHTYLHDGRGVFEELYLYGRRVGLLDFGSVTPHHMPLSVSGPSLYLGKQYPVDKWPELQQVTKSMNGYEGLVSILGYEYSVGTQAGGHHNVFYNSDSARSTMELDRSNPMAPVGKMLQTLTLAKVPTLVIPHIGGGPPDWSHPTDQRIERLFEIASVHGVFEESWQKHLESGQRVGAIAAGDTHTTSMGTAYPGLIYVNSNGLAGVYSFSKNRANIWDGLYERRTFATTNNTRMLADLRVNGEPMGGEIARTHASSAKVEARLSGTSPLVRVELVRNNRVIHHLTPARTNGATARIVWGDNLYQRRAAMGLREGSLTPSAGTLRMIRPVHLDQGFEEIRQDGSAIRWKTAAVSGDRDGALVDLSGVSGTIRFQLDDADTMGVFDIPIDVDQLRREGRVIISQKGKARHPYMEKMGVAPALTVEAELVDPAGAMDATFTFEDREPLKSGDYFYIRAEQLDTNRIWSSPVWVN